MAHGTRGRARGRPTTGQGWRMPCRGFERLESPIDKGRLAGLETRLKEVHEQLTRQVQGPIYFPFMFYRQGEVRAAQSYMAKFPAALVPLFTELSDLGPSQAATPTARRALGPQQVNGDAGVRRVQDPKLRRAVEEHAVRAASRYYTDKGATRVDELGKPYDLRVIGLGPERHVEVKGSSVAASAIELTVNEVTHAHNHKPTDLVVVDQISVRRGPDGEYATAGGVLRIWTNWEPDQERLAPTQFRYSLD